MTGLDGARVYLDWNATAPLRPEARAAMLEAMDAVGNPSSVHAEGRAARAIVERARGQVARLVGCEPSEIVFTSGATEAAHIVLNEHMSGIMFLSPLEHDSIWFDAAPEVFSVTRHGLLDWSQETASYIAKRMSWFDFAVFPVANSETGILSDYASHIRMFHSCLEELGKSRSNPIGGAFASIIDATQAVGKRPFSFAGSGADFAICSGHKIGSAKGVGGILVPRETEFRLSPRGGGQEMGRRSGTENVIGIAGFGAAAEAALRDLEAGVWERVEKLRNILEDTLAEAAPETIFFGQESPRLPNTSCFAVPGWRGETQVMQMDLAGFAVSAGSACSSGKVKESRVLRAMGYDAETASSAIRVSMGPTTTEAEVLAFADAWKTAYAKRRARAA